MFNSEFVFLSNGDFEMNQIIKECSIKNISIPNYFTRCISLKKAFPLHLYNPEIPEVDFNKYYMSIRSISQVESFPEMLNICGLEKEERKDSGINEAKNLARIVIHLLEKGYEFT